MLDEKQVERERAARQVLSELPPDLHFQIDSTNGFLYELSTESCVIQLGFDRYDSSSVTVLIINPKTDPDHNAGMSLWVLREMRGIPLLVMGVDQYRQLGKTLTEQFGDLLHGDFSCRDHYDVMAKKMFEERWGT